MSNEVAKIKNTVMSPKQLKFDRERVNLIKRTYCRGATDDELALFISTCEKLELSPEARQVFAVKRWDSQLRREVMSIQISIDGQRLVAERTGQYAGQLGPYWTDGSTQVNPETGATEFIWLDAWVSDEYPTACKVGVLKKGFEEPLWGVARWKSYVQTKKDGTPNGMWHKLSDVMLAKCAESIALRKAFPNNLSGSYTEEEMSQEPIKAEHHRPQVHQKPQVLISKEERVERMIKKFMELDTEVSKAEIVEILEEACEGVDIHDFDLPQFEICGKLYKDTATKMKELYKDTATKMKEKEKEVEVVEAQSDDGGQK